MLAATAPGNPGVIARPITWDATLVEHHAVALNAIFATIQLLLGLGIALRPLMRFALAASIAWSLGVWWFGEGLGGVLSGTASPVSGAPGAVIIYALLAVLLWPATRGIRRCRGASVHGGPRRGRARGQGAVAGAVAEPGLTSRCSSANRAPQAMHDMIAGHGARRARLAGRDRERRRLAVGSQGLAVSIVLAVACVLIAVGVCLPRSAARATLVLALVVAAAIWVFGEAFGMILAGGATDPNSGPLLVLLALAYWPAKQRQARGDEASS